MNTVRLETILLPSAIRVVATLEWWRKILEALFSITVNNEWVCKIRLGEVWSREEGAIQITISFKALQLRTEFNETSLIS